MQQISQMDRIEMLLGAQAESMGLTEWIGSYAHGRTSTGDPYIVLFPSSDKRTHKACRVYPYMFRYLAGLGIDTNVPESVTPSKNGPDKAQGTPCRRFQAIMHLGKETQTGREKRFYGVLQVGQSIEPTPTPAQRPQRQRTQDTPAAMNETTQAAHDATANALEVAEHLIKKGVTDESPETIGMRILSVCGPISHDDRRRAYVAMKCYYNEVAGGMPEAEARRAAQLIEVPV